MSDETTAGGEDGPPSRVAGGCVVVVLATVAVLVLKAVVTAAPYVAYTVVGILCTLGWQKARARWGKRGDSAEGEPETARPDVGDALRRLVGDDNGVLLTRLRDDLKLPDTKVVKQLLDEAGIPWKAGRTREGNGPSVRREHIPPAASPVVVDAHGGGCCCRSDDNGNTDNGGEGVPEKGIRVDRTDDGLRIHDLRSDDRHGSART
ncbi:hypothetical protein QBB34_21325 [Streptomyces stelliscabiei]|uniref:hypothetical protein n=1 Tax=Streptomyces stelliscabiei TaxID=146820 RepID=UPI002FF2B794